MVYYYSQGKLTFTPTLVQHRGPSVATTASKITTDNIRPSQLYVESDIELEAGHLSNWTGEAAMFDRSGEKITDFSGEEGHEYALSKIETCDGAHSKKVAGVVLETAAGPDSSAFLHKNVHSYHSVKNNLHIMRLATPGACVLAWVLDGHENALDGVYQQYINGLEGDKFVVRELGENHFSIERIGADATTADMIESIEELAARMDALTQDI